MTSTSRPLRLLVLGASGGTGQQLVTRALERQHRVTALVRSPEKLAAPRDGLTVVAGDPRDPRAVAAALAGHDAIVSVIGPSGPGHHDVMRDCARACVAAMATTGVRRLVVVAVALLFPDAGWLAAVLRKTFLRGVARDAAEMESVVAASDTDWTIVRPPRLTSGPRTAHYAVAVDRLPPHAGAMATLSRADLAHFLVDEVERGGDVRRIVGIAHAKTTT